MGGRNGLAIAALLLLVACGGGGERKDEDASQPLDAGGEDARVDAGRDAGTDAEPDAEPDPEADAEADAAADSEIGEGGVSEFSCSSPGTMLTASAGGEAVSPDGKLRLVLAPGALAGDATVHVCRVPNGQRPTEAQGDGPLSDVYFVEAGAAFEGTVVFSGAPLPVADGAGGFEPVTLRHLPGPGADPTNMVDAVLTLADSTRLSATLAGNGFVYVRALDPRAQYNVELPAPKSSYVTGEVIALGALVEATGTPDAERSLAVDAVGCDLETIEPAGVAQTDSTSQDCSVLTTVVREGADVAGSEVVLAKDMVIDLTDADPAYPPPSFFCKFPGAGKASARLRFVNGAAAELTVVRELAVSCSYSGDIIAAYDTLALSRVGPDVVIGTDYQPTGIISFVPDGRLGDFELLGADGVFEQNPSEATLTPISPIKATAATNGIEFTTVGAAPNSYEFVFDQVPTTANPFLGAAGGMLTFELMAGPTTVNCTGPTATELGLAVGAPQGSATAFSFGDGAALDAVLVVGAAGDGSLAFQRWLRPELLPLSAGVRSTPLLSEAQKNALPSAGATIARYIVGFFRVAWDERRAFWPGADGRIVPLACGVALVVLPAAPGILDP